MLLLPVVVVVFCLLGAASVTAAAPPTIAAAEIRLTLLTARQCHVTVRYKTAGTTARGIDHRLRLEEGTEVSGLRSGGEAIAPTRQGRTLSALAGPGTDGSYELSYEVRQPASGRFRCPIWLPAAPTSGGPTGVTLIVRLPEGATAIGTTFPSLRFVGREGRASLRDLPSFVRAPFSVPGTAATWTDSLDAGRLTDALAAGLLAVAWLAWLWWRRP